MRHNADLRFSRGHELYKSILSDKVIECGKKYLWLAPLVRNLQLPPVDKKLIH